MRQKVLVIIMVSVISLLGAGPVPQSHAADASPPVAPAPADPQAALKETETRRKDTLKYGIESEIFELLDSLKAEKDGGYNAEILGLFMSSRSLKLRSAILDFWSALEWKGGEAEALGLVEGRDNQDPALVSSALAYLAQIRSRKALSLSKDLLKEADKKILPSLLKLLGRAGGPQEEEALLAFLETDDASEDLKQGAIRALGDFGSGKAADKLMRLVEDPQGSKTTRMAASESLGKIGDSRAVKSLVIAANGDDVNVKASAIGALGNFKGGEADRAILGSLRDAAVLVRIAGCKALAARKLEESVPALVYKASYDPEKAVKIEAFKALGEVGGKDAFAFLRSYLDAPKSETALKVLAFGVLLRKDPSSMPSLVTRLSAEATGKDKSLYVAFAKELAGGEPSPGASPLARVLFADQDYLMRLGGLEWARRNKVPEIRPDLERLSVSDPSDYIRKKALEILAGFK